MLKRKYLTPTEKKVIKAKCEKSGEDYEKRIKIIEDFLNKKPTKKRKRKQSNNLVYDYYKNLYNRI